LAIFKPTRHDEVTMTEPTPPTPPTPVAPAETADAVRRDVTRILQDLGAGALASGSARGAPPAAADQLLPLVYQQLRAIAQQRMTDERKGHTLQATALVHEAYIKLVGDGDQTNWSSRGAFFKAAAEAMRRILIDHARSRGRVKRGGAGADGEQAATRVPLSIVDLAVESDSEEILALDEAICRLEGEDADVAAVVRFRFFAGLSGEDTAKALDISPRQVDRLWAFARARLFQMLHQQPLR
jgi:RNA polymerase sigma factor (TIGR02999 family)